MKKRFGLTVAESGPRAPQLTVPRRDFSSGRHSHFLPALQGAPAVVIQTNQQPLPGLLFYILGWTLHFLLLIRVLGTPWWYLLVPAPVRYASVWRLPYQLLFPAQVVPLGFFPFYINVCVKQGMPEARWVPADLSIRAYVSDRYMRLKVLF